MATATAPSREDFAKLLDESFGGGNLQEGSVIKGRVVGIEKEFAVIDVGLKTEGRVALREFTGPGRSRVSSSTRSRADLPSILMALWRSCRDPKSISARSATSRR